MKTPLRRSAPYVDDSYVVTVCIDATIAQRTVWLKANPYAKTVIGGIVKLAYRPMTKPSVRDCYWMNGSQKMPGPFVWMTVDRVSNSMSQPRELRIGFIK